MQSLSCFLVKFTACVSMKNVLSNFVFRFVYLPQEMFFFFSFIFLSFLFFFFSPSCTLNSSRWRECRVMQRLKESGHRSSPGRDDYRQTGRGAGYVCMCVCVYQGGGQQMCLLWVMNQSAGCPGGDVGVPVSRMGVAPHLSSPQMWVTSFLG